MDHAGSQINPQTTDQKDNPEVLKAKVQRTRAEINETVNSIQERLSPERMKQQVKDVARGRVESMKHQARLKADELRYQAQVKADEWRYNINERISSNPLPAILAGVGVIWLMKQAVDAAREEQTLYYKDDYYTLTPEEEWPEYRPEEEAGRVGDMSNTAESMRAKGEAYGQEMRERGSQWKHQAQEYAGEWKSRAQDQTGQLKARAQARAKRAKGQFQSVLQDNPLAVGATVFAVGAAIGLSLPRTQREDDWLGEARDRLIDQAKATAQEAKHKVEAMAGEVKECATGTVREQTEKTTGREEAGRHV
jgi:ElaB/YqjD/DUF883 family membrane-anchored ribosome-binding protein